MATEQDIETKRASVESLRVQIATEREAQAVRDAAANNEYRLARLNEEEMTLQAELAALRAASSAPAPAAAAPAQTKPSSDDAAQNKE